MTRTNVLWRVFIPLLISVVLSSSAYFFMMRRLMNAKNFQLDMREKCPQPWTGVQPFQRNYLVGYAPALEQLLCILVAFFDSMFKPEATQHSYFFSDFLVSFMAPITVPLFEASRTNRPLVLAFPMVVGILYQSFGGGTILPLYWGLFLVTTGKKTIGTQIDQASAEAVLFGLAMGFILPTCAMGYFSTVETIAFWQPFPLWISLFQQLHLLFRPRRSHQGSGYRTVQATWLLIFLTSTALHFRTLSAYKFNLSVMVDAFLPTLTEPTAEGTTTLSTAVHFLQWDMVYIFGSTLVASLWFAESNLQVVLLAAWGVISSLALGPGAAVAGVFLWRERKLRRRRESQISAIKASKTN